MEYINFLEQAKLLEKIDRKKAEHKYSEFIDFAKRAKLDITTENNLRSSFASAYNNRGYLRYLSVDFDQASNDYTSCLTIDPNFTFAYYNRGMIHYRLGRFDEAIKDMTQTLKLDPSFEQAKIGLDKSMHDKQTFEQRRKEGFYNS
ncbi:tetratricopeptide repeat protein 32-like [Mytilus trossulus]|uniref:tetratricopeptide repeat protein 32-like n=1 Tax=Mytilus trossulus TaxID=6551 RepID=UPI00300788FE